MYISRIKLLSDGDFFNFIKETAVYDAHQFLWKIFPKDQDIKRDFIFRQEKTDNLPIFYTVSERKPLDSFGAFQIDTKEYDPKIKKGDIYSFTLRANPTVAKKTEGEKNSKNHDVCMAAKLEAKNRGLKPEDRDFYTFIEESTKNWLSDKRAELNGYKLSNSNISIGAYIQNRVYRKKGGKPILYSSVDYTGLLEVTEPELFKELLFNGIGRSKAFGCGLMLIRRI